MSGWRRWALLLGLLGLLIADGALWSHAFGTGRVDTGRLLRFPEQLEGQLVLLTLVEVTAVHADHYVVDRSGTAFEVRGDPAGLAVGDELYVKGRFASEGPVVRETWRELAPDRGNKRLYGILGLLAVGLCLPFALRVGPDGLVLRG